MSTNGHDRQIIVNGRGDTRSVSHNGSQTDSLRQLQMRVNYLQMKMSRTELASAMAGESHDGRRKMWKVFGYPDTIKIEQYWAWYRRGGIARRIIRIYPVDTWKGGFAVKDGEEGSKDKAAKSAFVQAWVKLAKALKVWRHFKMVDILSRVGRFSVLLIGAIDREADLAKPLGIVKGIAYLSVFGEPSVKIEDADLETNVQSPRFGLPNFYHIRLGDKSGEYTRVHYSRVIHVAEEPLDNDLYGDPALEVIFNNLIDKLKVTGGTAESAWLLMHPGLAIISENGAPDDPEQMQEEVDRWKHGFDRVMQLIGVKLHQLSADMADPRSPFDVTVDEIAASTGIPRRKLLGTEEGQLAGSQDERGWNGNVSARRTDHAQPVIAEPFIDWCIAHKVLPEPDAGEYEIEWAPLFEETRQQKAETGETVGNAIRAYCGNAIDPAMVMPPEVFAQRYLDYTIEVPEDDMLDEEDDDLAEGDDRPAGGAPASEAAPENLESVKGLNGAQITAALEILAGLSGGTITATVATELLVALGIDRERVDLIVKSTGAG